MNTDKKKQLLICVHLCSSVANTGFFPMKYGLIAGSGRFPILALEEARRLGHQVVAIALREEAAPEVEALAWRCHWISIGELGKLIKILKAEGITEIMMAGQVKHARIFSLIRADWRLAKLLA